MIQRTRRRGFRLKRKEGRFFLEMTLTQSRTNNDNRMNDFFLYFAPSPIVSRLFAAPSTSFLACSFLPCETLSPGDPSLDRYLRKWASSLRFICLSPNSERLTSNGG